MLNKTILCQTCGKDSQLVETDNKGVDASNLRNIGWVVKLPILLGISEWLFCCSQDCYEPLINQKKIEYKVSAQDEVEAKQVMDKVNEEIPKHARIMAETARQIVKAKSYQNTVK